MLFSPRPLFLVGDRSNPDELANFMDLTDLREKSKLDQGKTAATENTRRGAETVSSSTARHSEVSESAYCIIALFKGVNDAEDPKGQFLSHFFPCLS